MIIGVTGTFASGKDTVAEYLIREKGFAHYSLSDEIRYEADNRGMSCERENLRVIGNDLREKYGAGILAERVLAKINKHDSSSSIVVSAIRNPKEVEVFRGTGKFTLIATDAPVEVRYERISSRKREGEDKLSLEDFVAREKIELSGASHEQQSQRVFEMADYVIVNDGTLEEFYKKIDSLLKILIP